MGIKDAMFVGVLGLQVATTAQAFAQDNPDEVAVQRRAEDRADPPRSGDPSDMDTSLVDPDIVLEPTDDDDKLHESDRAVRNPGLRRPRLGAAALQHDSEDLVDDAENDPAQSGRIVDRRMKRMKKDAKAPVKQDPKGDGAKDVDKKSGPAKDTRKRPAGCVDVSTEARFASIGYDHIVSLKSECKKVVQCEVRTNVTSEPISVTLEPGAEERVVTWRGSPARVFTPDVTCK